VDSFSAIKWDGTPKYLKTEIYPVGGPWKDMGAAQLWSVPYSVVADSAKGIAYGSKLSVKSDNDTDPDALFEVKRKDGQTVFAVYPDAVNVYVPRSGKGKKGGFAVGGFDGSKVDPQDYLRVTPDSVRIYIDPNPSATKATKGGFAVGGYGESKGIKDMYFNLTGASDVNTVDASPQILWYPKKNAFLAGNVHIGAVDSVGDYSTALGYRSIAMGNYSQAFGYRAKALGNYSTSIGKNSIAGIFGLSHNAFALGNSTKATGEDSYAFGSGAQASGLRSFAFGSVGIDEATGNPTTTPTTASQSYTFALGMGAQATQKGALALGIGSLSSGYYSNSFGFYSTSSGSYSTAIGYRSTAVGNYSAALGRSAQANGTSSIALGYGAIAGGSSSVSLGVSSNASGASSSALGVSAAASGSNSFAIGNNSKAQAANSYSFGTDANASLDNAYAIGKGAVASGNTSMSVGYMSQAIAQNAVAYGNSNISNGSYTVSLGNSNTAGTAGNAIALGNNNISSGGNSIALGNSNTSSGSYSIAIGTSTTSSNSYSTAIGYLVEALGYKSVSIGAKYVYNFIPKIPYFPKFPLPKGGEVDEDPNAIPAGADNSGKGFVPIFNMSRNNIADGTYSMAVGNGNSSTNGGLTFGVYNTASALYATGIGFQNNATGPYSFAGGYLNQTTGDFSTAFGNRTEAQSENVFVIGRYNMVTGNATTWVDTDPLFQIGNGTSTTTHDAFRVLKNGGTYIYGTDAYYGLNLNNNNRYGIYSYNYAPNYAGTTYGIRSYAYNGQGYSVYSGYFLGGSSNPANYQGLYADKRSGAAIDLAEYIYDTQANTEAADVVVADPLNKESVIKSSKPYQTSVVGVISTKPHLIMGMELVVDEKTGEPLKDAKPATRLALTGRVPVKVIGEGGPIQPGDMLTTSSIQGHAMKWTLLDVSKAKDFEEMKSILAENERRRNAILGKAVESFSGSGTGKIIVLMSLQ
ncbi:MAG: hypothetical protein MUC93_06050, partial [Bacteroidales bacterium]|nr:hypothetical protein [Bacteroidales bacterium]